MESINKQMDVDPCAEQEMEDLGALDIFDLYRVCSSFRKLYFIVCSSVDDCVPFLGVGVHESTPRQVRH